MQRRPPRATLTDYSFPTRRSSDLTRGSRGSAMKIGEIAKRTGLKIETVRFYEAEGLVPAPIRSGGNYRLYDRSHLDRLSFIKRSRDLGFTLDQVRALLRLSDDRSEEHTSELQSLMRISYAV